MKVLSPIKLKLSHKNPLRQNYNGTIFIFFPEKPVYELDRTAYVNKDRGRPCWRAQSIAHPTFTSEVLIDERVLIDISDRSKICICKLNFLHESSLLLGH